MATPVSHRRGRLAALRRLGDNPHVYNIFVLSILACGILLMVLPAELLSFKPAEVGTEGRL